LRKLAQVCKSSDKKVVVLLMGEHVTFTGFSPDSPWRAVIDYILFADNGIIKGEKYDKAPW
jgi:hypothetical protein